MRYINQFYSNTRKVNAFTLLHITLIFVVAAYVATWLQDDTIYMTGDYFIPISQEISTETFSVWLDNVGLGRPNESIPLNTIWQGFFIALKYIGMSPSSSQQLYLFVGFLFSGISFYYLMRTLFPNRPLAALLSALLYMYNPFIMTTFIFLPMYAVIPSVLAFFAKSLLRAEVSYAIAAGLLTIFVFLNVPNPLHPILTFFLLISFSVFYVAVNRSIAALKRLWLNVIVFIVVMLGVNFWWMPPTLSNFTSLTSFVSQVHVVDFGKGVSTLVELYRWLGSWAMTEGWAGRDYIPYGDSYFDEPLLLVSTFYAPLVAFSVLLKKVPEKLIVFFAVLAITGLFLSKGSNEPFGQWYEGALNNIDLFKTFRDSHKFMFITTLAYAGLIGVSLDEFYTRIRRFLNRKRPRNYRPILLLVLFMLVIPFFYNVWPMTTGDVVRDWYAPEYKGVKIPGYYYEAAKWVSMDTEQFRVLSLPLAETYQAYKWGYQGIDIVANIFTKPVINGNSGSYIQTFPNISLNNILTKTLEKEDSQGLRQILDISNIKYVIIDNSVDTDFYSLRSTTKIAEFINSQQYLEKSAEFGQIVIFEYGDFKPKFLIEDSEGKDAVIVEYQKISPTKYRVLVNTREPFLISFSEAFDSNWIATSGTNIFNPISLHGLTNGFKINEIGFVTINIEYSLEKYFLARILVSLSTLVVCLFILAQKTTLLNQLYKILSKIRSDLFSH